MQLNRELVLNDLRRLNSDRFAVTQLQSELETIELEFTAIKATNYDKIPSGGNGNSQRDNLENAIAKKQHMETSLAATRAHVADMERLLSQLQPIDRKIIERLEVARGSYSTETVAEEIGLEVRQTLNRKREAIEKLIQLRFGQGYQP